MGPQRFQKKVKPSSDLVSRLFLELMPIRDHLLSIIWKLCSSEECLKTLVRDGLCSSYRLHRHLLSKISWQFDKRMSWSSLSQRNLKTKKSMVLRWVYGLRYTVHVAFEIRIWNTALNTYGFHFTVVKQRNLWFENSLKISVVFWSCWESAFVFGFGKVADSVRGPMLFVYSLEYTDF